MQPFSSDTDHPLAQEFQCAIRAADFPCVGAKSALARGTLRVLVARDITSAWDDLPIYGGLFQLAQSYSADPKLFQSFAVVFERPDTLDERGFESAMWARLQSLSEKDASHGQLHDGRVSHDPDDPHFSLSFGAQAFFAVGLHPNASRPARRFRTPVLVFNLHDQFEQLRAAGKYEGMRDVIIDRDVAIAGSPNPMLSRHGEISEARQYSGRRVASDWQCPFQPPRREQFHDDSDTAEIRHGIRPGTGTAPDGH